MELSSKWDGLDRNTQRYIATIAAGSRQQSRFIALVEDYERNVELVDMAQNSAGASAAQFNVQLTGLQASLNRLQSAWEGLYTSINASNIFSFIVDLVAKLISSLGDLGLTFTSISTLIIFTLTKIAIASSASATKIIVDEGMKLTAINAVTLGFKTQAAAAKAALVAMLPQLATIGALILIVGTFAAGIYALNRVINRNKIAAREAAESLQEYTGKMGAANQEITSLESLIDEYNELVEAGEDTTEIRQQMIDQYPELAKGIDLETASQQKLNKAVEEYIRLKQQEAAENAVGAGKSRNEDFQAETKMEIDSLTNQISGKYGQLGAILNDETLSKEERETLAANLRNEIKELEKELEEQREQLNEVLAFNQGEIASIVANYSSNIGLKGNYANDFLEALFSDLTPEMIDETGNIKNEFLPYAQDVMQSYIDAIDDVMNSKNSELSDALSATLGGDTTKITEEVLQEWQDMGFDLANALPSVYQDYLAEIANSRMRLRELSRTNFANDDLADDIVRNWVTKFEEAKDDPDLLNAYKEIFDSIINGVSAENFTGNIEELNDAFNTLDPSNLQEVNEVLNMLIEGGVDASDELVDALMKVSDISKASLSEVIPTTFELADAYKEVSAAISDGVESEEDAVNLFQQMAEVMPELQNLSVYDLFTFDGSSWKLAETYGNDYLQVLQDLASGERDLAIAHIDEAIAKNNQVISDSQAVATEANALASELEAKASVARGNQILAVSTNDLGISSANLLSLIKGSPVVFNEYTGTLQGTAAELQQLAADLRQTASDAEEQAEEAKQANVNLEGLKKGITAAGDAAKNYGETLGGSGGSTDSTNAAAEAAEAYAEALKEQAEALEAAAEAEQKRIETEVEGIKKVLEAKKEALEEQNELLQEQIDKEKESQEILLEAYLKYLEKRQEEYQNTLDEMEKAAEEARELADKNNEELEFTNEIAQDYYQNQIDLIDEKINALNEEAEAEDRLQKLQEARDAYERAKNTKNRLVLVKGAGWVFKRDQDEISSTYDALQDAEREVEIAKLEDEKELLQEQADAWAGKAENIGKTTEELEKYNKAYEEFANLTEEQRKEALNAYIEAILKNNELNQDATDKENAFEDQSDADKEGTLAWNIAKVEELSEKTNELIDQINKSAEELIKDNRINEVVESLDNLLGEKGIEGLVDHFDTLASGIDAYLDNFLKLSQQITQNENDIESIEEALEDWDELTENLGKSQSELNKELEIFNRYNQMTIDQLSKDSAVYNDIANQVSNLADQWERVNAAQAAYEAAQERADMISKNGEGYATGGVNTYTGLASVHGTKSRPEVILNNSQAGALFKFIDGLTKTPTLLRRKNIPQNIESNNVSEDNSTNYTNCKFEVVSNQDNFENLLQDVKNRSPLRKF